LEYQAGIVTIKQSTDISSQQADYKIEICPGSDCDLFESRGTDSLPQLADYAYLYAVYIRRYVDPSKPLPAGGYRTLPFVDDAMNKDYAKQTLDHDAYRFHCDPIKDTLPCVLKALRSTASIRHMAVRYQQGMRLEMLVEDDLR
jgi:hypothetical protein